MSSSENFYQDLNNYFRIAVENCNGNVFVGNFIRMLVGNRFTPANKLKTYLLSKPAGATPQAFCDRILAEETCGNNSPTAFIRTVLLYERLVLAYPNCDSYMLYLLACSMPERLKGVFAAFGLSTEQLRKDMGIDQFSGQFLQELTGLAECDWLFRGKSIIFLYSDGRRLAYTPTGIIARVALGQSSNPEIPVPVPVDAPKDVSKQTSPAQQDALSTYCVDLTELAKQGKLDPLIGRESEMCELIETLLRRKKGNPILIGEPGAGKSAIVDGLAQKIAKDAVPKGLQGKRLLSLNLTAIMSGTMYRGQLEQRIDSVISYIEKCGNVILFIDELHGLVSQGESLSMANMLKPVLAGGSFQIIGATTLAEYRKYIEKDEAFARRFSKIIVRQPTAKDTVKILRRLKPLYEQYHNVEYSAQMLEAIVKYSERYLPSRQFPDKAIDIMDLAGVKANQAIQKEIAKTNARAAVSAKDIAEAISGQCGIPTKVILGSGNIRTEMLKIRTALTSAVVGQSEAIENILKYISRAKLGLLPPERPQGSFLFAGPTGVGKSLVAKILAGELYNHDDAFIKLDMSEYMEKHTVARLIGAPPGYVGHEEPGQLAEKLRKNPYALVLVDEIDKAHVDVLNIFLQILEDGRFTDSLGYTIDCRHATFIFTTNAGAGEFGKCSAIGFGGQCNKPEDVRGLLSGYFRPEFLNRIDVVVGFSKFSQESLSRILALELNKLQTRYSKYKFEINVSEEARAEILKTADTDANGARELRRIVEQKVAEAATEALIAGKESVSI